MIDNPNDEKRFQMRYSEDLNPIKGFRIPGITQSGNAKLKPEAVPPKCLKAQANSPPKSPPRTTRSGRIITIDTRTPHQLKALYGLLHT
ncbi:hypothetical protein PAAG_12189 [Paracoccidioides lutzii Pb01]|uniref:Uncharacterized protein n=1 Tax=Paracoccidioides lutzii (strain ATCC MYA-826 / Pb01) TaxID=502779 RepID=A0A0A2V032_PARBA|nr:hypothetical protein PAAG_12189 [Paracoccidioides lutzii Pb01]KGQ01151.1 hypothetical protein PAAG_12189 [Paracoccidioides lutzii Pb01]